MSAAVAEQSSQWLGAAWRVLVAAPGPRPEEEARLGAEGLAGPGLGWLIEVARAGEALDREPDPLAFLRGRCAAARAAGLPEEALRGGMGALLLRAARADALRAGCSGHAFAPRSRAAIGRLARRIQRGRPSQAEARTPLVAAAVRRVVEVAGAPGESPTAQVAALLREGLPEPLVVAARLALLEAEAPAEPLCPNPWFGLFGLALSSGDGAAGALPRRGVSRAVTALLLEVTRALRAGPDRTGALLTASQRLGELADPLLLLSAHLAALEAAQVAVPEPLGLGEQIPATSSGLELPPPEGAGLVVLEPGGSEPCLAPAAAPEAPRTRRRRRSTARMRRRTSGSGGAELAIGLAIAVAGALAIALLVLARGG